METLKRRRGGGGRQMLWWKGERGLSTEIAKRRRRRGRRRRERRRGDLKRGSQYDAGGVPTNYYRALVRRYRGTGYRRRRRGSGSAGICLGARRRHGRGTAQPAPHGPCSSPGAATCKPDGAHASDAAAPAPQPRRRQSCPLSPHGPGSPLDAPPGPARTRREEKGSAKGAPRILLDPPTLTSAEAATRGG